MIDEHSKIGEKIQGFVAENEHHEAEFVRDEIVSLQKDGKSNFGETAIFYRTNAQSRVFEEVFMRSATNPWIFTPLPASDQRFFSLRDSFFEITALAAERIF